MTMIKICGITNKIDAVNAAGLGVNMLGFVFYEKSGRCVDGARAREIVNELPPFMQTVGVFVDEAKEKVAEVAEDVRLDMLQFHGDEKPAYCAYFRPKYKVIKAFRIKAKKDLAKINDYDVDFYLFDTYIRGSAGGTGRTFDWKVLKDYEVLRPVILSGGLTPKNVAGAIREVAPYAVDVSTGVETSLGAKDLGLMRKFVENVRSAD